MASMVRQVLIGLVVLGFLVSVAPGIAIADSGVGGTIVVAEGETVSSVNAVGGAVFIHGTVTGDVNAAAGNVVITGSVGGDVNVGAGNLRIAGDVGGDVSAGAGNIHIEEGASIDGNLEGGAGQILIDGTISGDVQVGAETIHLGDTAMIVGSLTYDGTLTGNHDAVAGEITRDRTVGPTTMTEFQPLVSWAFAMYAFIANFLLGIALLALFPRFSDRVAVQVTSEPIKTGVIGLGVLIGIPILLVLVMITIIGIPLALAGAAVFLFLAWVSLVYGRFALGMWLLSPGLRTRLGLQASDTEQIAGIDRKWVALVFGLFIGVLLAALPVIGGLINLVIFLLGLGALILGLHAHYRSRKSAPTAATPEEPPAG